LLNFYALHDKNLRENRPRSGIQELEIAVLENQEYSEVYLNEEAWFLWAWNSETPLGAIYESS
jgi:hypothetical protein